MERGRPVEVPWAEEKAGQSAPGRRPSREERGTEVFRERLGWCARCHTATEASSG